MPTRAAAVSTFQRSSTASNAEAGPSTRRSPSRAERSASGAEPWLQRARHRRRGAHGDELVAVDADDHVGDGAGRARGARCRRRRPGARDTAAMASPATRSASSSTVERGQVVDERHRGDGPAERLGDDDEVGQRGAAATGGLGRAHARGAQLDAACPTAPDRSRVARRRGPRSVGLSLAKKPSNSSAMASWSAVRPRSTVIGSPSSSRPPVRSGATCRNRTLSLVRVSGGRTRRPRA